VTEVPISPPVMRDIDSFDSAQPASGGDRIRLDFTVEGCPEALALPVSDALKLAFGTLGCEAACRMIKNPDDVGTAVTAVESYQLGIDNEGAPVVTFTSPTGGRLTFSFKLEHLATFRSDLGNLILAVSGERATRQ